MVVDTKTLIKNGLKSLADPNGAIRKIKHGQKMNHKKVIPFMLLAAFLASVFEMFVDLKLDLSKAAYILMPVRLFDEIAFKMLLWFALALIFYALARIFRRRTSIHRLEIGAFYLWIAYIILHLFDLPHYFGLGCLTFPVLNLKIYLSWIPMTAIFTVYSYGILRYLMRMKKKDARLAFLVLMLFFPAIKLLQQVPAYILDLTGWQTDIWEFSFLIAVLAGYGFFAIYHRLIGIAGQRIFQTRLIKEAAWALVKPHKAFKKIKKVPKRDYVYLVPLIFISGLLFYFVQGYVAFGMNLFGNYWWFSRVFAHAIMFLCAWLLCTIGLYFLARLFKRKIATGRLDRAAFFLVFVVLISPIFDLPHLFGLPYFSPTVLGIETAGHFAWFFTFWILGLELFFIFKHFFKIRGKRLVLASALAITIPFFSRFIMEELPTRLNLMVFDRGNNFWYNIWLICFLAIVGLLIARLLLEKARSSSLKIMPAAIFLSAYIFMAWITPNWIGILAATSTSSDLESGTITRTGDQTGTVTYTINVPSNVTAFYTPKATLNSVKCSVGFTSSTVDNGCTDNANSPYSYCEYKPANSGSWATSTSWNSLVGASTQEYTWNSGYGSWSDITTNTATSGNQVRVYGYSCQSGSGNSAKIDVLQYNAVTATFDYNTTTLAQNYYRWYENLDAQTPTTALAAENTDISDVGEGGLRLRMSVLNGAYDLRVGQQFKLQYGSGGTCSSVSNWADVGNTASTTADWRFKDNASATNGSTLSSNVLSVSDTAGTYQEANSSAASPNQIAATADGEWDWSIERMMAHSDTTYCFRMVESDETVLTYNNYPQLTTGTNYTPAISSVGDDPDPVNSGSDVTFSADWSDQNGEGVHLYVCSTNAITPGVGGAACDATTFCSNSNDWDTTDPIECSYTTQVSDDGANDYYAFICDNEVSCSSSSSGSFTVNAVPAISSVIDDPDPVISGSNTTFSVDWSDQSTEGIKMFICKTDEISTGTPSCTGGQWCSNSDDWDTTDPIECEYNAQESDSGVNNYYAFVCDNEISCSSSSAGSFTVNIPPGIEFVSVVDPGGTGDYSSLSEWNDLVKTDLTAATTQVFAGTKDNITPDNITVYLCTSGNSYRGESARIVHATSSQILVDTIASAVTEATTDYWYSNDDCTAGTKYFTLSNGGDKATAVAKCRTTNGAADTTAVTISGWTTDSTHYIKIWTDPSEPYRHQGKWDDTKYRLEGTSIYISISEDYVKIDGLQVKDIANSTAEGVISMATLTAGNNRIDISNNIVRGECDGTDNGSAISNGNANNNAYIYNNIVYGFNTSSFGGIYISNGTNYVYNNTVYDSVNGIRRDGGTVIIKNNIVQDGSNKYLGTFDAASSYNVTNATPNSDIAFGVQADSGTTTSASSYKLIQTGQDFTSAVKVGMIVEDSASNYSYVTAVDSDTQLSLNDDIMSSSEAYTIYTNMYGSPTFEDEANKDFHLDSSDTVAKNKGANLYADGSLAITTDIDNNARPNSATLFDIGADENIAKIYRSVAADADGNMPAIITGTSNYQANHLAISGIYATFELPLPDNVGVGDAIQYDANADGSITAADGIAFIDKRFSSQKYRIKAASGVAPTAMTVPDIDWSIFRAYTSLDNAAGASGGTENTGIDSDLRNFDTFSGGKNLTTNNEQWNVACYANGTVDTAKAVIAWGNTTADNYVRIYTPTSINEVGTSQRQQGKWDTNKYRLEVTGDIALRPQDAYMKIEGLQIYSSDNYPLNTWAGLGIYYISDNIVRSGTTTYAGNISLGGFTAGSKIYVWNNIIYGGGDGESGIIMGETGVSYYIYNNTIADLYYGINAGSAGTTYTRNNLISATDAFYGTFTDDDVYNDYNSISENTNDPSIGSHGRYNQTFTFVDVGGDDFHLAPNDAGAKNYGADLTNDLKLNFNTDIDSYGISDDTNKTRPYNTTWDIGADEVITPIYRSVAPDDDSDNSITSLADGGSNAMTVDATTSVATFTNPLPDNIGVGDVLQYDSNGNNAIGAGDTLAFITGRTDSTHYTVKEYDGSVPLARSGDTYWSIFRSFTSLYYAAEDGTPNQAIDSNLRSQVDGNAPDIKTASEQWNFACYANGTTADETETNINGWTTAPQNYIRVYTPYLTSEVGTSQRHQGKWDDGKYRLSSVSGTMININYARIEGLQIETTGSGSDYPSSIFIGIDNINSDVQISNNIIKGNYSTTNPGYGIIAYSANSSNVKIWNDIIYNFNGGSGGSDYAIFCDGVVKNWYVYNNTIYGSDVGISSSDGSSLIAKNNIAQDTIWGYGGVDYDSSSANNLSDHADAPGSNPQNSATVSFVSTTANFEDFHLATTDTGARDYGADLSTDPLYPPSFLSPHYTDIDGSSRPLSGSGLSWDIGADEVATPIYRSNGPSATSYLATGVSNHLNISGSTATFDTAPGDTIGVGDALEYDSDNNSSIDAVAFITGRTSSTVYTIKSAVGGAPVPQTAADEVHWNIFRAYSSLSNAEAGIENTGLTDTVQNFDDWTAGGAIGDDEAGRDIWTNNEQWNIANYANGTTADTDTVEINGWSTAPTNYIKAYTPTMTTEVGTSQRHPGKWDESKYMLDPEANWSYAMIIRNSNIHLEGLQIQNTSAIEGGMIWIDVDSYLLTMSNNIIKSSPSLREGGIEVTWNFGGTLNVYNSLLMDCSNALNTPYPNQNLYVYNNTFVNNSVAISSATYDIQYKYLKNNLFVNNTDDVSSSGLVSNGTDNNATTNSSIGYSVVDGGNDNDRVSQTFTFVDEAGKDFHLDPTDIDARNQGADLSADTSLPITTDIDGKTRPNQGAFDIGADEAAKGVYYSVGQNVTDHGSGGNMTIDDGIATFTEAQTATNLGVGDKVTYNTSSIAYLLRKVDTTHWYIITATGAIPADDATPRTVNTITHAFNGLAEAEDHADDADYMNATDLPANDFQLNIPCYYDDGPDTTAVTIDGWTTGPNNFIKIYTPVDTATEANQRQRHWGKWDTNKYYLSITNATDITVQTNYAKIDGIQLITVSPTSNSRNGIVQSGTLTNGGNLLEISNSIIRGHESATYYQTGINTETNYSTIKVWNTLVYGIATAATSFGIRADNYAAPVTVSVYNSTVIGGNYAINNVGRTLICKNCYASSTGTAYNATMTSCASSDTSGTAGLQNIAVDTTNFTNVTSGQEDYHLPSGSALRNVGANLSNDSYHSFSTDIDGNGRSLWDIGADEGSVEMEATVMAAGGDYSSLSNWQTGMVSDLVAPATMVFSGTRNSTIANNTALYLCRGETYQNVTATTVHAGATQLLAESISNPSYIMAANDVWYTADTCDSSNYFTISTAGGDPAIAVAKIDGAWGSPDTSAVTISGWETGANNYVKVYTTTAARHDGKWNEGKYRLEMSGEDYNVYIKEPYTVLDGLQMKTSTGSYNYMCGVYLENNNPYYSVTGVTVKNNIVRKGYSGSSQNNAGIATNADAMNPNYFYNNIIYDFTGTGDAGISINGDGGIRYTSMAYNNTAYNCTVGFRGESAIYKNNIAQNCTDGFNAWGTGHDYNISDVAGDTTDYSPSYNTGQITTVAFADAGNSNFHLSVNDSGAKNQGTDLSADANLAFDDDIDGDTRPIGPEWDIGADESAEGASSIPVYYSVGQTLDTHETGAGTVSVSGTTATFTVAQTAANMGVGDVVDYDSPSKYCYISGKTSTTVWSCTSATGGAPTAATGAVVNSIHHVFDSLSDAIDGADTLLGTDDLATRNFILNIPCYYDSGPDQTAVTVDGYTTGAENYIKIYTPNNTTTEVNQSQRHSGKWDDTKYRMEVTADGNDPWSALGIVVSYVHVDGLQIKLINNGNGSAAIRAVANSYSYISNNILKGGGSENVDTEGIAMYSGGGYVWNNIIYDFTTTNGFGILTNNWSGVDFNLYAYNNTVYNTTYGIRMLYGNASPHLYAKNNLVSNSSTADFSESTGGLIVTSGSSNNASSDGTAPGANSRTTQTFSFVDATNKDFHLAFADSAAKGYGTNLSQDAYLAFSDDIDSQERTGNWSIGADEPREAEIQSNTQKVNSITSGLVMYQSFDGNAMDWSNTSAEARDQSGNNNNGDVVGADITFGKRGQALSFNGTSDYVNEGNPVSLQNLTNLTYSAWVNSSSVLETYQEIFSKYKKGLLLDKYDSTHLYARFIVSSADITNFEASCSDILISPNTWTHVAVTWDGVMGAGTTGKFYINGQQCSTFRTAGAGNIDSDAGNNFSIGARGDALDSYFDGAIDEARVYNRMLSPDEIGDLYRLGGMEINTSQTGNAKSGLVGMWSFDGQDMEWDDPDAEALDRSGNANDGDVVGATVAIGKKGQALSFNGTNTNYVTIGDPVDGSLDFGTGSFSYGMWVYPTANAGSWDTPWWKGGSSLSEKGYDFELGSGWCYASLSDGSNTFLNGFLNPIPLNTWTHIFAVVDRDTDLFTVYVNGAIQTAGAPVDISTLGDVSTSLGAYISGQGDHSLPFDGQIDEVRIYDRALTPTEVGDLYRMGNVTMER